MANILSLLCLVVALTIHEFFHALAADRLGDPTPRQQGRLTLNPLAHLDPLGTLMLLFVRFGWGKPVPIDPYNFSHPRRDELIVSFSGPASNLILAGATSLFIHISGLDLYFLYLFVYFNITLAVFNLLPLPPLDGFHIFVNLLPEDSYLKWQDALQNYGPLLLAILLFLPFGNSTLIGLLITPAINFFLRLFLPAI